MRQRDGSGWTDDNEDDEGNNEDEEEANDDNDKQEEEEEEEEEEDDKDTEAGGRPANVRHSLISSLSFSIAEDGAVEEGSEEEETLVVGA